MTKVIAVCLGSRSTITQAELTQAFGKFTTQYQLEFISPPERGDNIMQMDLHLAREAPHADVLVSVQGTDSPTQFGRRAEEIHLFLKNMSGMFLDFILVGGSVTPAAQLAQHLAVASASTNNIT